MDVQAWTENANAKFDAVFKAANMEEHTLATALCVSSAVLCRSLLRDDVPGAYVAITAYLGVMHNPLYMANPEHYKTLLSHQLVHLALKPEDAAYRCAEIGHAVLFDLGGFAAVKLHGDAIQKVFQEVV
jgi:hypothetical protein